MKGWCFGDDPGSTQLRNHFSVDYLRGSFLLLASGGSGIAFHSNTLLRIPQRSQEYAERILAHSVGGPESSEFTQKYNSCVLGQQSTIHLKADLSGSGFCYDELHLTEGLRKIG
jgi:hypothetical protein